MRSLFQSKVLNLLVLVLFSIMVIPTSIFAQESKEPEAKEEKSESFDCYLDGKQTAKTSLSTERSFGGGFLGGVFLGLIGAGIAVLAQGDPVPARRFLTDMEDDCAMAFEVGFQEQGKSKKRNAALTGGLLGTLVFVFLVVYEL